MIADIILMALVRNVVCNHHVHQHIDQDYSNNVRVSGPCGQDWFPASTKHLYNIGPTSSTLLQHRTNVIQMFCFLLGYSVLVYRHDGG